MNPMGARRIDDDDDDFWFGFEQEYCIWDNEHNLPIGFPGRRIPGSPGPVLLLGRCRECQSVAKSSRSISTFVSRRDLTIEGINAEVMMGQWEFQVFAKGAKRAGDETWIARYLLQRVAERYGYAINLEPKPIKGDWNGSGHARELLEQPAPNVW